MLFCSWPSSKDIGTDLVEVFKLSKGRGGWGCGCNVVDLGKVKMVTPLNKIDRIQPGVMKLSVVNLQKGSNNIGKALI